MGEVEEDMARVYVHRLLLVMRSPGFLVHPVVVVVVLVVLVGHLQLLVFAHFQRHHVHITDTKEAMVPQDIVLPLIFNPVVVVVPEELVVREVDIPVVPEVLEETPLQPLVQVQCSMQGEVVVPQMQKKVPLLPPVVSVVSVGEGRGVVQRIPVRLHQVGRE
jgi:hypothetical protein